MQDAAARTIRRFVQVQVDVARLTLPLQVVPVELHPNIHGQGRQPGAFGQEAALAAAEHVMHGVEQRMPSASGHLLLDERTDDAVHEVRPPHLGMSAQDGQPAPTSRRR